jgi:putative ABC transport system permease protein
MSRLRWLAALLLRRWPDAEFVKDDLEELYARDRAEGMSGWRAHRRYARRLAQSMFSIWRARGLWTVGPEWLREFRADEALRDVRFGARLLFKQPSSTIIAITGLGAAIGVVVSVFTVVDATMLRPFGMDDPASVVSVGSVRHHGWSYWSYATYLKMKDEAALARLEASRLETVRIATTAAGDGDVRRRVLFVSGGYLSLLGGRPAHGRSLAPSDDVPGATPVAMISHHLWTTVLNGDPAAVGGTVWLNGSPVTLIGVMRPEFTGPVEASLTPAVWMPIAALDDVLGGKALDPNARIAVEVVARLNPDASVLAAEDNLAAIVNRVQPPTPAHDPARGVRLDSLASPVAGRKALESYTAIVAIFGIVGLVLALACANTANLLLASATTRLSEIGTRLALGASTGRLVGQMINESLLLNLMAGGLGLVFSVWLVPVLSATLEVPAELAVRPDGRATLFAIGVAIVCGLGASLAPARLGARGNVLAALRTQSAALGPSTIPSRRRVTFVAFQAAVSMFLLVAAALLARSAIRISTMELGFDVDRLLAVSIERGDRAAYARAALDAVRRVPSVERAALTQRQPFGFVEEPDEFSYAGISYRLNVHRFDASFFETAGLRVVRGRAFTDDEVAREADVILVSESVARAFFPGGDPIGHTLAALPPGSGRREPGTIIGVVGEAMLSPVRKQGAGAIYRPIRARLDNPPVLIVRATNPLLAIRAVDDALRRLDPSKRPTVSIVRDGLDAYLGNKRMLAALAVPTALLALLLATLGVYGVTSFVVSQRTAEVSVRMALGASVSDVARLLVRDSLQPVMIGLVAGLATALTASRLNSAAIGGVSPYDPLAVGVAMTALVIASLLAIVMPVCRAARTDPAALFRTG